MRAFFIGLIVGLICGAGLGYYIISAMTPKTEVRVNEQILKEKLLTCSELTSAKYQKTGVVTREESYGTGWKFFDQLGTKKFTIQYAATVTFAVDLSKADVKVDSNIVNIVLPSAKMQMLTIPADSLAILSEQKSIINWENKNDMREALKDAEEHAKATCDTAKMIRMANTQAVKTLSTLLGPLTETSTEGERAHKTYQVNIKINGETDLDNNLNTEQLSK